MTTEDRQEGQKYQDRKDIPEQYLWKVKDIYAGDELWEKDFKTVAEHLEKVRNYRGHVAESAKNLYQTLELQNKVFTLLEKIMAYASLKRDQNTADQHNQGLSDRATALAVQAEGELSFVVPEILKLEPAQTEAYCTQEAGLRSYRHFLDNLYRQQKHYLSSEEEEILALCGEVMQGPHTIFSLLTNADIQFPEIEADGEKIRLTQGSFIELMHDPDRNVRREAHHGLYQTFAAYANTLGATYSSSVKGDLFQARVRRYQSALESALDPDNLPLTFYDNLLDSVHRHLPALHRYVELKKKVLKVDELQPYDLYVPLTSSSHWKPQVEAAEQTVLRGLTVMGKEYSALLEKGFRERWVDVYETKGKRSGAYSMGVYGVHSYVLLNYHPSLENVFTIAHEMGHALHSYYTNNIQPYVYTHYPILLAEVASTVNEALLFKHLLNQAEPSEKAALLEKNLEQFRTTVFRQLLFAEFEKKVHDLAEAGQPLTPAKFSEVYGDLLKEYYGPKLVLDDYIRGEWARIPHFYSAFYVYKYATGFSSAVAISEMILAEGKPAVDRYIELLKSGSSGYPLDLLSKAGVNLADGTPVNKALDLFEKRLKEFEALI